MAEQVYQAGINAGWAKEDDSTLWRLFLPNQPIDTVYQMTKHDSTLIARNEAVSVQDIIDIFVGGHLAAAAEAMGFTEAVGLDTDVMYDIISKAAGSNMQFVENVPRMKKPTWSLREVPCARDVCQRLVRRIPKNSRSGLFTDLKTTGECFDKSELGRSINANGCCKPSVDQVASSVNLRINRHTLFCREDRHKSRFPSRLAVSSFQDPAPNLACRTTSK